MKFIINNYPKKILYLLVIVDFLFIGLHIANRQTDIISNPLFLLTRDRGYAEIFQYIKLFSIILLIGSVAIRIQSFLYFVWALTFSYMLIDDCFMLHETIGGEIIGDKLNTFFQNLDRASYPLGQVIYAILIGGLFLIIII